MVFGVLCVNGVRLVIKESWWDCHSEGAGDSLGLWFSDLSLCGTRLKAQMPGYPAALLIFCSVV